jgi:hypothetical protein
VLPRVSSPLSMDTKQRKDTYPSCSRYYAPTKVSPPVYSERRSLTYLSSSTPGSPKQGVVREAPQRKPRAISRQESQTRDRRLSFRPVLGIRRYPFAQRGCIPSTRYTRGSATPTERSRCQQAAYRQPQRPNHFTIHFRGLSRDGGQGGRECCQRLLPSSQARWYPGFRRVYRRIFRG